MNKVFRARIVWYHYIYFVLLLGLVITFFVDKSFIAGALFTLWVIYMVEKVLHTTYTITPERVLIISQGRFFKKRIIPIDEIESIDELYSLKVAGIAVTKFILIKHKKEYYSLLPAKEKKAELFQLLTNKE